MRAVCYRAADLPGVLRRQVRALQRQVWPDAEGDHDPLLEPVGWLLLDDAGRLVAALDVLHATITHAGAEWRAAGLSSVVVGPADRGRGHGVDLVRAARAGTRERVDLLIFSCDRPLAPFYERAGFRVLPGAVLIGGTREDPFPTDRPGFEKVVLADLVSTRAQHAAESFTHGRIGLYPGTIDRLW